MEGLLILYYSCPARKWPMPGRNKQELSTNWSQQACDEMSTRLNRERVHGSLGAELVIPAAAHWVRQASSGHTYNRSQG